MVAAPGTVGTAVPAPVDSDTAADRVGRSAGRAVVGKMVVVQAVGMAFPGPVVDQGRVACLSAGPADPGTGVDRAGPAGQDIVAETALEPADPDIAAETAPEPADPDTAAAGLGLAVRDTAVDIGLDTGRVAGDTAAEDSFPAARDRYPARPVHRSIPSAEAARPSRRR